MSHVELGYGRGTLAFEFEGGRFDVLEPAATGERPLTDSEIGAAIDDPYDSQPLEEIVSPGESVLVVVSRASSSPRASTAGSRARRRRSF